MGTRPTYSELLRDPRWQRARLKRLDAAGWKCESCRSGETTLNVHHKRYVRGRAPWEYEDAELTVLCEPCHDKEHVAIENRTALLARLPAPTLAAFFASGAAAAVRLRDPDDSALLDMILGFCLASEEHFWPSMFAAELDHFGVGRLGFEFMYDLLRGEESAFVEDLFAVFKKHKVPYLGANHDA